MSLLLASKSPRRQELMRLITEDFTVDAADIDEEALGAENPAALAKALAAAKAQAVYKGPAGPPVIGCDTLVALEGKVLGKPEDEAEARQMLTALSGRRHHVYTGVCVLYGGGVLRFTEATAVDFSPIPKKEIEAVLKTPEPYDKAGAYGIQGWAARFVPRIEGDYYNVMGLPVAALYGALRGAGLL